MKRTNELMTSDPMTTDPMKTTGSEPMTLKASR